MCTRFFAFDGRFPHEISSHLSDVYLLQKKKDCNLSKGNFNVFKEIRITYFKLDFAM